MLWESDPLKTLSEIPPTFTVSGVCVSCERMEVIDHLDLVLRKGDMTVKQFKSKVRCKVCGQRTGDIRIAYVGNTGFSYRDHFGRLKPEGGA